MTNGYETMLLMAWIASIIALCFCRNRFSLLTSSAALIIIALCMVVAGISGNNPYITHLMPVLQSPLLCLHVLCIMIAYAILCIIVVISLSAIIIRIYSANDSSIISQLAIINRIIALSCSNASVDRHISWSSVGKHFVGTILGMGP